MTFASPSPLEQVLGWLLLASVFVGPTGLFVLRRHLVNATGGRLIAKGTLWVLTGISAPFLFLFGLMVLAGGVQAFDSLWELLKAAW